MIRRAPDWCDSRVTVCMSHSASMSDVCTTRLAASTAFAGRLPSSRRPEDVAATPKNFAERETRAALWVILCLSTARGGSTARHANNGQSVLGSSIAASFTSSTSKETRGFLVHETSSQLFSGRGGRHGKSLLPRIRFWNAGPLHGVRGRNAAVLAITRQVRAHVFDGSARWGNRDANVP